MIRLVYIINIIKMFYSPHGKALFKLFEEETMIFVDCVQVGEDEVDQIFRHQVVPTNHITEPLESKQSMH